MKFSFFIVAFLIAGCQGFVIQKHVVGNYYLVAVDADEDLSLCYNSKGDEGYPVVIGQTVFGVGYNGKYIIVEQHPHQFAAPLVKDSAKYFIVPVHPKNELWIEKEVLGPFANDQFLQKKKALGIEKIQFSIVYERLR